MAIDPSTRRNDQGNTIVWDTDGFWVVESGPEAGLFYWGGKFQTGKPSGTNTSGSKDTYKEEHRYGGSQGPGTYEVDPVTGAEIRLIKLDSSGGGGTTIVNQSTGGSKFMVMYGPEGYGTYEVSTGTPILIGLKTDPNAAPIDPRDKDRNGIDDGTGMAVGVYKDASSPTGYSYGAGQPVYPNGTAYTGSGGSSGAPDLVNGKYIWDPVAKKYVIAPGMESTGGSTNISVSGIKSTAGSGGGGSYSSAPSRDYAAEDAANDARAFANQKALMLLQDQLKNDPNNPYLLLQQQGLQLQMQNEARQAAKDAAETKRGLIKDFQDSVTSTDPSAMHSWLYANGVQNGGNIVNRLSEGGDALSPNVLTGTAALLQMLRGQGANIPANYTAWMNALPGLTQATAPGAPAGAPTVPTPTGTTPTPMGGLTTPGTSPTTAPVQQGWTIPQRAAEIAAKDAQLAQEAARANGWRAVSTPGGIVYREYVEGAPTGKSMSAEEYKVYQAQTNPQEQSNVSEQEQIRAAITAAQEQKMPYFQQARNDVWTAQSQADRDAWVQAQKPSYLAQAGNLPSDYVDPFAGKTTATGGGATVYKMPGVGWVDTNQVASTGLARDISTPQETVGTAKPYIPPEGQAGGAPGGPVMRALGGNVPGMAIVGDSVSGRPTGHEELVIDPTADSKVIPINRAAMARMGGLPRLALGGSIGPGWDRYRTPTVTRTTTTTPTTSPSVPVATQAPATGTEIPYSPPQLNTTPANPVTQTAPVTPTQPTQPTYNGQAGTTQPVPMQGLTTPSGTYQTNTITPGEQALMDEARDVRETVPIPDIGGLSPYSLEFQNLAPSIKEAWFKGMAAKKGVNPNDFMAEVGRNVANMPGLSRGQFQIAM